MSDGLDKIKVSSDGLETLDVGHLEWVRVSDAYNLIWKENPKLHDIGAIAESISRYGFRTLPVFDSNLENIANEKGAIVDGNGRTEALNWMEKQGWDVPRGLGWLEETSEWCMRILVGTDADSADMARAYAIDANNLTLSGGDLTAYDFLRLWDRDSYLTMIQQLSEHGISAVSVDASDMAYLLEGIQYDVPDHTGDDEVSVDRTVTVKMAVGDISKLDEIVTTMRQLTLDNPDWKAKVSV